MIPGGRLAPIVSDYGHRAGNPEFDRADEATIRAEVSALLADFEG